MKKVTLIEVTKQSDDLYTFVYIADGRRYIKTDVYVDLYGYSFDPLEGVDHFNITVNEVV